MAFFGLALLLNQQVGGFLASFEPSQALQDLWRSSNSRFFQLLLKLMEPISQGRVEGFCSWADDALAKLEEHPEGTGHDRWPMTLARLMSMLRQSLLLQVLVSLTQLKEGILRLVNNSMANSITKLSQAP